MGLEQERASSFGEFCPIQRHVSGLKQPLGVVAVSGGHGRADRGTGVDFMTENPEFCRKDIDDIRRKGGGIRLGGNILLDDDEFIAAKPGDDIAGAALRDKAFGYGLEESVPAAWPSESLISLNRSRSMK